MRVSELVAFSISKKAVEAASDVAEMEGEGRKTRWMRVEIVFG